MPQDFPRERRRRQTRVPVVACHVDDLGTDSGICSLHRPYDTCIQVPPATHRSAIIATCQVPGGIVSMISLKRQRTNLGSESQPQKRACNNLVISNLVQNTEIFQSETSVHSTQIPWSSSCSPIASVVPKRCIHKIVTACNLTQATCCACLDVRPDGSSFVLYMDGRRWGQTRHRWQYYCNGCQSTAQSFLSMRHADSGTAFWSTQDDLGHPHLRPLGFVKAKQDAPDIIKVNYGTGRIDIVRSVDLTLDGLKAEVARLMRCDPSHLMLSDSPMYMRGSALGSSHDDALTSHATHIKFTCVTSRSSEADAMEDVQYVGA